MKIVMDFDDFCEEENELQTLVRLQKANGPKFKVTLFTIPGKCSRAFLKRVKKNYPWVDIAIHGWNHGGKGECSRWDKKTARHYLESALNTGYFVSGFKAPQWMASPDTYLVCRELGLWVAEIKIHKNMLPPGLKTYILEEPIFEGIIQTHGHISPYPSNYIRTHFQDYVFGPKHEYLTINNLLTKEKIR